jgi:hypothetical protein
VKITLHDGRTIVEPRAADLDALFAGLSDPADFMILKDEQLGELRAAGPHRGTFLLQCDLPRSGAVFRGERSEVGVEEATDIFRDFLGRRVEWSRQFAAREAPPGRVARVLLALAVIVASAFLWWWFRRGA